MVDGYPVKFTTDKGWKEALDAAVSILTEMQPHIGKTTLNVLVTQDATAAMCLGPHCQCYAKEKQHEGREGWGKQVQEQANTPSRLLPCQVTICSVIR